MFQRLLESIKSSTAKILYGLTVRRESTEEPSPPASPVKLQYRHDKAPSPTEAPPAAGNDNTAADDAPPTAEEAPKKTPPIRRAEPKIKRNDPCLAVRAKNTNNAVTNCNPLMEIEIRITDPRIGNDFPLPDYATDGSAGKDLCACLDKPVNIAPAEPPLSAPASPFSSTTPTTWRLWRRVPAGRQARHCAGQYRRHY